MSFHYPVLFECWANKGLNNVSFVYQIGVSFGPNLFGANFKARLFFTSEPCNEKYSFQEGHFAFGTLPVAFIWLGIDRKFEWEMMSKTSLVTNKWAFAKHQYVINTLIKISVLYLSSYPLISFQNSQELNI